MSSFIARRLLQAVPTLLGITIVVFLVVRLAPGDPFLTFDPTIRGQDIEAVREARGLNQPLPVQYVDWVGALARGDLGRSFQTREPVLERIWQRLGNTLTLAVAALVIGLGVGIPAGVLAAVRRGSWLDQAVRVLATVTDAVPVFWLGLVMIMFFAVQLHWLPVGGVYTLGQGGGDLLDRAKHLIMPSLALATGFVAVFARYMRTETLEVIGQDYIRTARVKGLPESVVISVHALRNALLPLVTALGGLLPGLISGAAVTEIVFTWPGMGRLALESVLLRDYPVVLGLVLIGSVLIVLGQLLSDLLYAVVDPRVRLE